MGYWEFDGSTITSFVVQTGFEFYDISVNKSGTGEVQLSNTLVSKNK